MSKKYLYLLGIITIMLIFAPGCLRLLELRQKNKALLAHIEELKTENQYLDRRAHLLESDPFYIEKAARDKIGMGREGELRYRFVYESQEQSDDTNGTDD
ncbi:MAG: septum formation initiator family protein [Candidatus Omnitrophica bacterium]|jgi:cell division protein FtsB|nr:septum formation initiator family protein [Candidatus Omnitrophota bacterium]